MAATLTVEGFGSVGEGNLVLAVGDITIGTYATGGVAAAINSGGLKAERIADIKCHGGGYVSEWLKSSQLLKVYRQKDPANAGGADIALPEVGNGVDLSGQTWTFTAICQ